MNAWSAAMDAVQVLGWTLLHFLWQAALIGAIYASARRWLPRGEARYLLGMSALFALALCPVLTAWRVADALPVGRDTGSAPVAAAFGTIVAQGDADAGGNWWALLSTALPWLVLAWSAGVVFLSARMWRHWRRLRALVRAAEPMPVWQERLRRLSRRFDLRRGVRVLISARVPTPTLVGWIRPVILLPLAVSSGFPVEQVELILAHELAHLRRLDHFANLFQVVLETLLFYHPVVHWISRDVRNERELCCDALALRVTGGSRREFATALVGLEEFRGQHAGLTLAASGGVLLERIGQITGGDRSRMLRRSNRLAGAVSALLVAGLLLALLWRQAELRRGLSDSAADVGHLLTSQLLPASIRLPVQTIANLVPGHITASPVAVPVRAPEVTDIPAGSTTPQSPVALAHATPTVRIADLSPSRLELAPVTIPASPTPVASAPTAPPAPDAPTPIHIEQPVYPIGALEQQTEGKVVVEFSLDADGNVHNPEVVDAAPANIFDHAATHALLGWKFAAPTAAELNRRYRQTFSFTLHPDGADAGREVHAKAGCYAVTGSNICRVRSLSEAAASGILH